MASFLSSKDSVSKTIYQISIVALDRFVFNKKVYAPPDDGFVVSKSFWRSYKCFLDCGACCHSFTKDFLPDEFERFAATYPQFADDFKPRDVSINFVTKPVFTVAPDRQSKYCQYMATENGACTLHLFSPYSCGIELIKVGKIKNRGYIQKKPYGRAFQMKRQDGGPVLCEFCEFDYDQFVTNDIVMLKRLDDWAYYFEIETALSSLLFSLECLSLDGQAEERRYVFDDYISGRKRLSFND